MFFFFPFFSFVRRLLEYPLRFYDPILCRQRLISHPALVSLCVVSLLLASGSCICSLDVSFKSTLFLHTGCEARVV